MPRRTARFPDAVPVLSRGKHRTPRRGACFMEFASWLAGERFSDHPACTHPLLATVARGVNDHLSDDGRQRIVQLTSSVVGLVGSEPMVDISLTVHAATTAMPVAAFEQQKAMAVGLLRCESELESPELASHDGCAALLSQIEGGLAFCPDATRWAQQLVARSWGGSQDFSRAAMHIVRVAVTSISVSPKSDDLLCGLLETCVAECQTLLGPPTPVSIRASASEMRRIGERVPSA